MENRPEKYPKDVLREHMYTEIQQTRARLGVCNSQMSSYMSILAKNPGDGKQTVDRDDVEKISALLAELELSAILVEKAVERLYDSVWIKL